MIVTIDGPAGAGKSTVARMLARRLGYHFLDTGAMYRAVAYGALRAQIDLHDAEALLRIAHDLRVELQTESVKIDGDDVTAEIRSAAVTEAVHFAADQPEVRRWLVELQRQLAADADIVSEGRDQGTVAFPGAECKLYLSASPRERAKRRQREMGLRGEQVELEALLRRINQRDQRDATRRVGRMQKADDAIEVDTDGMTLDQVVDHLEGIVRSRQIATRPIELRLTMQRHWIKRIGYRAVRVLSRLRAAVILFRFRSFGSKNMPADGPVLVCSNHQSNMDPVLVGLVFGRRLNFVARKSLFGFAPFRWLIHFLDAIPIDRDGMGLQGIKESIRRLRRGEAVLIFPEGTRTKDGELAELKPGFCALARRTKAALLPVAIDGAYQAWPRNSKTIRLCRVQVRVGEPIRFEDYKRIDDQQLVAELHRRIQACHQSLRDERAPGGSETLPQPDA